MKMLIQTPASKNWISYSLYPERDIGFPKSPLKLESVIQNNPLVEITLGIYSYSIIFLGIINASLTWTLLTSLTALCQGIQHIHKYVHVYIDMDANIQTLMLSCTWPGVNRWLSAQDHVLGFGWERPLGESWVALPHKLGWRHKR